MSSFSLAALTLLWAPVTSIQVCEHHLKKTAIISCSSRESSLAVKCQRWPAEKWEWDGMKGVCTMKITLKWKCCFFLTLQGYCVCVFRGSTASNTIPCHNARSWTQEFLQTSSHFKDVTDIKRTTGYETRIVYSHSVCSVNTRLQP